MAKTIRRRTTAFLATALVLAAGGCATSFTGSPHVEGGRGGCVAKCRAQGMECVGMVYMGEYSDACVCSVPGASAMSRRELLEVAASGGAAAGVIMQMRAAEQRNQMAMH